MSLCLVYLQSSRWAYDHREGGRGRGGLRYWTGVRIVHVHWRCQSGQ